jgi:16S rRNA processing protein RimM
MDDRLVLVGRIVGVFGVAGAVKLHSFTEPRENIFSYRPWLVRLGNETRAIDRAKGKVQGKGMVATLPGVDDRDAAAALMGAEIYVQRSALPQAAPGEVYWSDLEGLRVSTVEGRELGVVSHLFATGANDVLVVKGERERLVPFIRDSVVREIDLAAGTIVVDWDPDF